MNASNVNVIKYKSHGTDKMIYNKNQDLATTIGRMSKQIETNRYNQETHPNISLQVTCYNCKQNGHVSRYFSNKRDKNDAPRFDENSNKPEKPNTNAQYVKVVRQKRCSTRSKKILHLS